MVDTYIIAEIGINHMGDVNKAKKLIEQAAGYGVDAVKFQTYNTDKRVSKKDKLYNILKKCELDKESHLKLQEVAKENGIDFISTPFDIESLELLQSMDVPLIKVSSFDVTNTKFLRKIAKTGIPVIMSTGMCSAKEIERAYKIFKRERVMYYLLHCVSAYPVLHLEYLNLSAIRNLKTIFKCPVGYSDHSKNKDIPAYAVLAGAEVIEVHFSDRPDVPDGKVSLIGDELEYVVQSIREVESILGMGEIELMDIEADTVNYRRFS